ncbi:MAG TPA: TonB family protein [Pyrinomonadaceae bacterium]|jgi:TonB family protein
MKTASLLILFTILAAAGARAQTPAAGGHFSKEGISFDYPEGWSVEDRGDARALRFRVAPPRGAAYVEVSAPRAAPGGAAGHRAAEEGFWESSVEELARSLGGAKVPKDGRECPPYGERPGAGVRLKGRFEGRPSRGEVYELYADGRYVNVAFFRPEQEEAEAAAAWRTMLESLRAEGAEPGRTVRVIGTVVNGKAVSKPQPAYPPDAKSAGADGAVTVKITVDEKGDVVEARGVSGDPRLYYAAEAAARHAKYTPTTICGRPVKVSGAITYTFVRQ